VRPESGQQPETRPEQARVFFALWPPPDSARYLADVAGSFAARAGGRAILRDAIHLTLAFLGDVAVERLPDLERAAREVRCEAFNLTLDRCGVWRHNRIFQAGCSVPPAALAGLAAALAAALPAAGFAVADARRPFIPHVTLVRKLVALDGELPECEPVAWSNRQFVLARSTPSAHGSSYRIIAEFPLLAGAA
jgi:2'-5' RNA ligase